ncbi:MAG: WD40 repeat domain-containing protein, partial [Planctomycetaceae bacterium]|nr:WD40 repeat domain-containing protein [Planctomycetaceae bacterium]
MAVGVALAAKPQPTTPIALGHHEVPIFLGPHEHAVTALAFAPDGKTLATGCGDSHLRMWDCATGRLKSIHTHDASRGISGLAYAPDGRSIAAVGAFFGPEAILWDTATGDVAREFPDHPRAAQVHSPTWPQMTYRGKPIDFRVLRAVAFSPDGKLLVTAPDELLIHNVDSGELLAAPRTPGKSIAAVAFTADGKLVATADDDRCVRLWSMPDGRLEATLDGPNQPLTSIAVSSDGRRVAACSHSLNRSFLNPHQPPAGTLWIWDRLTGPPRGIPLGAGAARQVAFPSPDKLLVTSGNRVLEVDAAENGEPQPRLFWSHSEEVQSLAISPDGRLVACGGIDRTADIVESATRKLVHRLPGLTDIYSAVNVSADGRHFAAATLDVRFSNRRPATDESFAARSAEYFGNESNQGRMQAGGVQVWSLADGRRAALLPLPAGMQVTAVKLVPDSQFVAIGGWLTGEQGKLALWDWKAGQPVREYLGNETEVLSLAVSPDGRYVVSGNAAGEVNVYDLATSAPLHTIALDGPAQAVAFSADGKQLAVTNGQRLLQIHSVGDWV